MADVGRVVLHAFASSSCTWRVRLVLDYKGIPYEYKAWNLSKGEHLTEEYKKICPLQSVPSLEIDGAVLSDSMAIIEYLEERFPEKPLLPRDLKQKAAVRSVVYTITSGIQPLQNLKVLNAIEDLNGKDARLKWAQKWIASGFHVVESILEKTAGKYSFGDELTLADVVLVAQMGNARRFKVDLELFPTLLRVCENLFKLELIVKSTPDCQPDFAKLF